jgi:hypothetical protein
LCSEEQEGRFLLLQCHPPPKNCCSTGYKRLAEGGGKAFGFLRGKAFWLLVFEMKGGLWKGKGLPKGKGLFKGKLIAEGKVLVEDC